MRKRRPASHPGRGADDAGCAKQIITTLARRAFRRPVTAAEVDRAARLLPGRPPRGERSTRASSWRCAAARQPEVPVPRRTRSGRTSRRRGVSHQRPRAGVAAVVLPLEQHPGRRAADAWPSRAGCTIAAVLERQVRRMLADPRADALVTNFAGQWLHLRNLRGTTPDKNEFPDFDDNLRQAFQRETELFFGSIMREDRSVLDLLTADYTFVNERLARHYGIPNVYGSHFRRVAVRDEARQGSARPGQHPAGDLARRSDLAGRARQVGARQPARHAAAAAAARCARRSRTRTTTTASRTRCASGWRSTARIPACATCHKVMDPIGLRARELRRGRRLADPRRRARRSTRRASSPTARAVDGVVDAARRRC